MFWNRVKILALLIFLWACEKGKLLENQPPDTYIFLDSIGLSGANRLTSVVRLHWSGEDPDGIVKGFEISIAGQQWQLVTKQDSTFRFTLETGSDTSDIRFYVRAIDNAGLSDPTPAFLRLPLRNTAPTALYNRSDFPPDTSLPAFTLSWEVNDLDGFETIDSVYLKINEGAWYGISPTISSVSILPENTQQAGISNALVYPAGRNTALSQRISGINIGGQNVVYLRAKDKGALFSSIDTTKTFFLKVRGADVLVVTYEAAAAVNKYLPALRNTYNTLDWINYNDSSRRITNPTTFSLILTQYKQLLWFSEGGINQIGQVERFESVLNRYVQQGGKFLLVAPLPRQLGILSPIFRLTAADSLVLGAGGATAILQPDKKMVPLGGYPELTAGEFITSLAPFHPKSSAEIIYNGELSEGSGAAWTRKDVLGARLKNEAGKIYQILIAAPLYKMNPEANIQAVFEQVKRDFE
jgi:hypothetical protein